MTDGRQGEKLAPVAKEYDERRTEILETATALFSEHGYDETSVNMIIEEIGIAKGTFYHYFRSKDELLEVIVEFMVENVGNGVDAIAKREDLTGLEKMVETNKYFRTLAVGWEKISEFLHEDRNAHWHLKLEKKLLPKVYNSYEFIIKQGIAEGDFHTEYPRETAIAILGTANALGGKDHDHTGERTYDPEFIKAVMDIYERILGMKKGIFMKMYMKEQEGGK